MRYLYSILIIFSSFYSFSQVGIGTTNPTATLDVDGDLRVRNLPLSSTTDDTPIVVDANGNVKRNLSSVEGNFRGRLFATFDTGPKTPFSNGIYLVNTIGEIIDSGDDFDHVADIFTAPITGIYEITMTYTISGISNIAGNYVVGLINQSANWVMRFSMIADEFENTGNVGVAKTYTGLAELKAGQKYAFGVAGGDFHLLVKPEGTTGSGIGSYFRIELIDN